MRISSKIGFLSGISILIILSSCQQSVKKPTSTTLDDIHILSAADPELGIDAYDSTVLMEKGGEAFNAGNPVLARKFFGRLISQFPKSPNIPAALYNIALSCESSGDMESAMNYYSRLIAEYSSNVLASDARFRLGSVLMELKKYSEARDTYQTLLVLPGLSEADKIEAGVGIGVCLFNLKLLDDAENAFLKAMGTFRSSAKPDMVEGNYYMAESQYYLGEIGRVKMEDIKLEFPESKLEKDLELKARLLLEAQGRYIRVLRMGSVQWTAAAGFKIGFLYETFHKQVLEAPVPQDLDQEQVEIYRTELRKKVSVLVSKAIVIYERTIEMAQRIGMNSTWIDETSSRLEKLKKLYIKENLQ